MKKCIAAFAALLVLCLVPGISSAASPVSQDGYFKNIRLAGKVKIVEHFPDIKVKAVDYWPDLKVKLVSAFPDDVGEWQIVEFGEDFKIQFVEHFPDIKIKFVSAFPGVAN